MDMSSCISTIIPSVTELKVKTKQGRDDHWNDHWSMMLKRMKTLKLEKVRTFSLAGLFIIMNLPSN